MHLLATTLLMALLTAELANSSLYQVSPIETISQYKDTFDIWKRQFGYLFKDKDQCEYFFMLPLSAKQRLSVLEELKADKIFLDQLRTCDGSNAPERTQEHRNKCLKCVLVNKLKKL